MTTRRKISSDLRLNDIIYEEDEERKSPSFIGKFNSGKQNIPGLTSSEFLLSVPYAIINEKIILVKPDGRFGPRDLTYTFDFMTEAAAIGLAKKYIRNIESGKVCISNILVHEVKTQVYDEHQLSCENNLFLNAFSLNGTLYRMRKI